MKIFKAILITIFIIGIVLFTIGFAFRAFKWPDMFNCFSFGLSILSIGLFLSLIYFFLKIFRRQTWNYDYHGTDRIKFLNKGRLKKGAHFSLETLEIKDLQFDHSNHSKSPEK